MNDVNVASGIRVFTLADFKWMKDIPELSFPCRTYDNCLVEKGGGFLYDREGEPIPGSIHHRGQFPRERWAPEELQGLKAEERDVAGHLDAVVFIPFLLLDHFGHLLTESVSWLAALTDPFLEAFIHSPTSPTILLGVHAAQDRDKLSALLSIPSDRIACTTELAGLTRIGRVYLPERTMANRHYITQEHFPALKRIVDMAYGLGDGDPVRMVPGAAGMSAGRKVHLSRSMLPPVNRHLLGEKQIEEVLVRMGWEVVYPERLGLSEQIERLRNASVISGNLGSAFHLLMYLGTDIGSKCIITLGSPSEILDNHPSNNIFAQLRLQRAELYHVSAFAEPCIFSKPDQGSRWFDLEILHPPDRVALLMESLACRFLLGAGEVL